MSYRGNKEKKQLKTIMPSLPRAVTRSTVYISWFIYVTVCLKCKDGRSQGAVVWGVADRVSVHTSTDQRPRHEGLEHADDAQTAGRLRTPGQLHRVIHSLSPAPHHAGRRLTCRHLSHWRCRRPRRRRRSSAQVLTTVWHSGWFPQRRVFPIRKGRP